MRSSDLGTATTRALNVAQRIVDRCDNADIPIPQFQTNIWQGGVTLEVGWYRSSMREEHGGVTPAVVEAAFDVTFNPANGIGNHDLDTVIDGTPVEFVIYA